MWWLGSIWAEISRSLLPTSPWGLWLLLAPRKSWIGENVLFGGCPGCDRSISYSHQPFIAQPSGKLKSGSHSNYHPLPPPTLGGLEKRVVNADVISPSSAEWAVGRLCCCSPAVQEQDAKFSEAWGVWFCHLLLLMSKCFLFLYT